MFRLEYRLRADLITTDKKTRGRCSLAPRQLLGAARECWDRALAMGQQHGHFGPQVVLVLLCLPARGVERDHHVSQQVFRAGQRLALA